MGDGSGIAARYAAVYEKVESSFYGAVQAYGVPFEEEESAPRDKRAALASSGTDLHLENNEASIWRSWISPACIACRRADQSATFFSTLRCTRSCFFCFNPNQDDYERYRRFSRDMAAELREAWSQGASFRYLAITGGEPMLEKDRVFDFLETARELYPDAHVRLYTSGDLLNPLDLKGLAEAGLDEIRFSLKKKRGGYCDENSIRLIAEAVEKISATVVEMPVMPEDLEAMQEALVVLDRIGVRGINLLELCFPLCNAEAFLSRGYRLRRNPYWPLYNYWYAGGLPVAGSESVCLQLLRFAEENNLSLGVHYCSLDNKNSGQIYQQNAHWARDFPWCKLSETDFFLKSIKVFGRSAEEASDYLAGRNENWWRLCKEPSGVGGMSVEMHPDCFEHWAPGLSECEGVLCYYVVERTEGVSHLREVAAIEVDSLDENLMRAL